MPTGLQKAIDRHEKWWLGKYIRRAGYDFEFKKVVKIITSGAPSYVYGMAELFFEDGTTAFANIGEVYRPRKQDWEVCPTKRAKDEGDSPAQKADTTPEHPSTEKADTYPALRR